MQSPPAQGWGSYRSRTTSARICAAAARHGDPTSSSAFICCASPSSCVANAARAVGLSANDMHRYIVALKSDAIVPPDVLRVAFAPALLNNGMRYPYGFRWDVSGDTPTTYYGHAGA